MVSEKFSSFNMFNVNWEIICEEILSSVRTMYIRYIAGNIFRECVWKCDDDTALQKQDGGDVTL